MTRRVKFSKAIIAGASGALVWEAGVRLLTALHVPVLDLTYTLGATFIHRTSLVAWLAGVALHAFAGALWGIFYAYFFWSEFPWRPALQGMCFSLIPMLLAGFVMLPQLRLMRDGTDHVVLFALDHGWAGPLSIILGHLLYGFVLGALYTHPVGYPVRGRRARYA